MKHANFSTSALHRTVRCHASFALSRNIPRTSSKYADEGTAAHALADLCLRGGTDAADHIGVELMVGDTGWKVTDEMAGAVQVYLDLVREIPGTLHVEVSLPIGHFTGEEDANGTCDACIVGEDEIVIVDYKHGRGVAVDVNDNEQFLGYASAALLQFGHLADFKRVQTVVVQPRAGNIQVVSVPLEKIRAFEIDTLDACNAARNVAEYFDTYGEIPVTAFTPGEKQCRWCPARHDCTARAAAVMGQVTGTDPVFPQDLADLVCWDKELSTVPATGITPEQRARILESIPFIEQWITDQKLAAEADLAQGKSLPGWKMVEGRRGPRKWGNPMLAGEVMSTVLTDEQRFHMDLISPAEAEKLLKKAHPAVWAELSESIHQAEGKPVLAPESDKRPSIHIDYSDLIAQEA